MISCSHWGMFEDDCGDDDETTIMPKEFWEMELLRRFPNGITPTRTPFMDLIGGYDAKYLHNSNQVNG